jgi:hypothetical protein
VATGRAACRGTVLADHRRRGVHRVARPRRRASLGGGGQEVPVSAPARRRRCETRPFARSPDRFNPRARLLAPSAMRFYTVCRCSGRGDSGCLIRSGSGGARGWVNPAAERGALDSENRGTSEGSLAYQATVYKVMIASPSDVVQERRVIREVIHEWNSIHAEDRGIVLMPIGWETHSSPSMGERAQEIINA